MENYEALKRGGTSLQWQRLDFDGRTLRQAAEPFNLYNRQQAIELAPWVSASSIHRNELRFLK